MKVQLLLFPSALLLAGLASAAPEPTRPALPAPVVPGGTPETPAPSAPAPAAPSNPAAAPDAAPAAPSASPTAPDAEPQMAPGQGENPGANGSPLMPGNEPTGPQTKTTFVRPPAFHQKVQKPSRTQEAENDLIALIRFREAKVRAFPEPDVQAALHKAQQDRTDYEKRADMKRFYQLLYDHMEKLDKRFPLLLAQYRGAAKGRFSQLNIIPTEPPLYSKPAHPARP